MVIYGLLLLHSHELGRSQPGRLDPLDFLHPYHLVPDDLAPVATVTTPVSLSSMATAFSQMSLAMAAHFAPSILHALNHLSENLIGVGIDARVDDVDLLPDKLVGADNKTKGGGGGGGRSCI